MIRCRAHPAIAALAEARMLLCESFFRVRILEARFHPASRSSHEFVVVGRVRCEGRRTSIERLEIAPAAVKPFDASHLHEKLEFLVMAVIGDPARGLLELRSGFWSFVETSGTAR
jgi:hypothetical protein